LLELLELLEFSLSVDKLRKNLLFASIFSTVADLGILN
jgi:hypothetical protein